MSWRTTSSGAPPPPDPVVDAVAEIVAAILRGATVEARYTPVEDPPPTEPDDPHVAAASDLGPPGWRITFCVRLGVPSSRLAAEETLIGEILHALPGTALRTVARFRADRRAEARADGLGAAHTLGPAVVRAMRDVVAAEILTDVLITRAGRPVRPDLVEEILDFLVELSGLRVESHDLTHGIVITNVLRDEPRLRFAYPADIRSAKRGPLLFDGQRSLLAVDLEGRARTELQRHRIERLGTANPDEDEGPDDVVESGWLVAEATRRLNGMGFLLRADRTIWAFVDGQPLLVRRGEHWTAFPLELESAVSRMIDGGSSAGIVVRTAFIISGQRHGAILAVVRDPDSLDGIVPLKDRYDLRATIDEADMRPETRLHHLIDAEGLDEHTLARLAALDGATVLDRDAGLLAYGAVVASSDSQHEGARTAAARTLSETAEVVLKVSADGDITIFKDGAAITTLLGLGAER